jgi:hypothetical protein
MRLRIYSNIKPSMSSSDSAELIEKIYNYLGPSVVDFSGWGLLRPGLLTKRLVLDVCNIWRAERRKELVIYDRPQLRGEWIFFDYLFSKVTSANPIIKCLTSIGLAKYGETKLTNTYLTTVGFNYKQGLLLMLYNGKKIESQLDDLAYIISHMLKTPKPKLAEINNNLLSKFATYLESSPRWQLKGWISKEGRTIELDLVQENKQEYLNKLKRGEWQSLLFQDRYSKIKPTIGPRIKTIDVFIKKKFYNPGPKRDLRPTFEELAKGINTDKLSDILPSSTDEAGILRAYTERRGVIAVLKYEKEKHQREAFDVSYEFPGYDVKSEPHLIEVKAFKDSTFKSLQLTANEYETMNKEENYHLYVVEEAWDNIPKVNIINDPKKMPFAKQSRDVLETKMTPQEYFECGEDKWRSNVTKSDFIEL